jgi:signal transduction histidine kinase
MQIVNQHGGSISLESEAGKGAMFSVRLPVEKKV